MPTKPFEIYEEDFAKTALDYIMYEQGINASALGHNLLTSVLYSSNISLEESDLNIQLKDYRNESR